MESSYSHRSTLGYSELSKSPSFSTSPRRPPRPYHLLPRLFHPLPTHHPPPHHHSMAIMLLCPRQFRSIALHLHHTVSPSQSSLLPRRCPPQPKQPPRLPLSPAQGHQPQLWSVARRTTAAVAALAAALRTLPPTTAPRPPVAITIATSTRTL